jgi:hypothetical protein
LLLRNGWSGGGHTDPDSANDFGRYKLFRPFSLYWVTRRRGLYLARAKTGRSATFWLLEQKPGTLELGLPSISITNRPVARGAMIGAAHALSPITRDSILGGFAMLVALLNEPSS